MIPVKTIEVHERGNITLTDEHGKRIPCNPSNLLTALARALLQQGFVAEGATVKGKLGKWKVAKNYDGDFCLLK